MAKTDRFNSFAELETEKLRLLALRVHHEDRLQLHWDALRDREVRGALMSDAASDIVRSWKPFRVLASLFGNGSGNGDGAFTSSMFGAAISGGSWGKRMFRLALNLALPALLTNHSLNSGRCAGV